MTMGRHFSESEVSAMSRNRVEDKGLRQRLFRLHEEKTNLSDLYAKERKKEMNFLKENKKTSGNIQIDFDDTEIPEDIFKDVLLSRRPWSCTPHETTFNVIYREATDPALLKASYLIREKGKSIARRASAKVTRTQALSRQSTRSEPVLKNNRQTTWSVDIDKSRRRRLKSAVEKGRITNNQGKNKINLDVPIDYTKAHTVTIVYDDDNKDENNQDNAIFASKKSEFDFLFKRKETNENFADQDIDLTEFKAQDELDKNISELVKIEHLNRDLVEVINTENKIVGPNTNDESNNNGISENNNIELSVGTTQKEESHQTENDGKEHDIVPENTKDSKNSNVIDDQQVLTTTDKPNLQDKKPKLKRRKRLSIIEPVTFKSEVSDVVSTEVIKLNDSNTELTETNLESENLPSINSQEGNENDINQSESNGELSLKQEEIANTVDNIEQQLAQLDFLQNNELNENSNINSVSEMQLDENAILYKGKVIHDYVKPHLRYKHDPFAVKSRERLIRKLTVDIPVVMEEDKLSSAKLHRLYSKGARKRMLKQLVDYNNTKSTKNTSDPEQDKLKDKIHNFYESISDFIRQNCGQ